MTMYLHPEFFKEIENLKENWDYELVIKKINEVLVKDPMNPDSLMQLADTYYRMWDLQKAEKPIDFLLQIKGETDALILYIKWVIEMEKTNWLEARRFLQKALDLSKAENHEIMRCFGLAEYRYGNREKWIMVLESAFDINHYDAEVIYNLIELYLLEYKYAKAKTLISYYFNQHKNIQTFDKDLDYYDHKISLFKAFIEAIKK